MIIESGYRFAKRDRRKSEWTVPRRSIRVPLLSRVSRPRRHLSSPLVFPLFLDTIFFFPSRNVTENLVGLISRSVKRETIGFESKVSKVVHQVVEYRASKGVYFTRVSFDKERSYVSCYPN